jgi:hypothetical protein
MAAHDQWMKYFKVEADVSGVLRSIRKSILAELIERYARMHPTWRMCQIEKQISWKADVKLLTVRNNRSWMMNTRGRPMYSGPGPATLEKYIKLLDKLEKNFDTFRVLEKYSTSQLIELNLEIAKRFASYDQNTHGG